MRYVSSTITRDKATLPVGFDFTGTTETVKKQKDGTTKTFVEIPAQVGVFEGNETPEELDKLAKQLFGDTIERLTNDDDGDAVYERGTPVTFPVACTQAFRLAFQKYAFAERTPEGAGRLTNENFKAILTWFKAEDKAAYNEAWEAADGNVDAFKAVAKKRWIDAGKPALW